MYHCSHASIQYVNHSSSVPGCDEELHLHLLELAGAEDEVAGGDLVAEALADLGDAERWLEARARHDVGEVDEDALRGLGAQVVQPRLVVDRAEEGLQQAAERARLGPLTAGAAVLADDVGHAVLGNATLLLFECLEQVILAVALVAALALDERVGEHLDVSGGLPHALRQDDRRSRCRRCRRATAP